MWPSPKSLASERYASASTSTPKMNHPATFCNKYTTNKLNLAIKERAFQNNLFQHQKSMDDIKDDVY